MRRYLCPLLFAVLVCGQLFVVMPASSVVGQLAEAEQTAADFFVAADGSDQWSGKLNAPNPDRSDGPFATLVRARDAVRALKQLGDNKQIRVLVRGGVYRLDSTIVFSLDDSAPADGTITYAAYGDETPTFTSGVPIVGWHKPERRSPLLPPVARDAVWIADVPAPLSNVLTMYDGQKRLRRASSKPFAPVAYVPPNTPPNRFAFPAGAMKKWPDLKNADLRIIPSCDYEMCLLPLAAVDETAAIATTAVPASRPMGRVKFMDETAWVENVLEVLDEPGEWVIDATDRKLYLWPVDGTPSEAIIAPLLTELLRVEGEIDYEGPADKPVTGLVFQGLTFTGAERLPWHGDTKGGLQHKWEHFDAPSALLRLRGAQQCTVQRCRFVDTGGTGLRLDLTCQDNRVIDNEVAHTGGVGILVAGYGPGTKDVNHHNDVSNNWVHHIGEIYWASPAIMVWQSGENRVTHNLIHNTPYSGITVSGRTGWPAESDATFRAHEVDLPAYDSLPSAGTGSNAVHREWWQAREKYMHGRKNLVAWNDIHDVMETMGDGNGIYISGTGKENHIYQNYVHHLDGDGVASGIRCDNDQYETIVDGNVLYKVRSAQSGISTTETNHIINNIIVDVIPSRRPITKPNIVHGYISIPDPTWPIEGARISRNIIWSPRADYWPIVEHRSLSTGAGDRLKNTSTDYNLYWCPADPQWGQRHIDEQRPSGAELHSLSADPLFVDVDHGDLRLRPESPARQLGIPIWDISTAGLLKSHPYRRAAP
ncbi:MAG TPA: right-handed parallel beta-helix repeat-containing protein [Pirellulales bacterium]